MGGDWKILSVLFGDGLHNFIPRFTIHSRCEKTWILLYTCKMAEVRELHIQASATSCRLVVRCSLLTLGDILVLLLSKYPSESGFYPAWLLHCL